MFGPDLYEKFAGVRESSLAPKLLQLPIEFRQIFCTDIGGTRLQSVSRGGQLPSVARQNRVLNTRHRFARRLNKDAQECLYEFHATGGIGFTNGLPRPQV